MLRLFSCFVLWLWVSLCEASLNGPQLSLTKSNVVIQERNPYEKLGVLLLNLGGPEKEKDVEGFLYNLFADPDIIRLPGFLSVLQKPLAYAIAKRRAPKSQAAYRSIGGGSPINAYTQAQAQAVRDELIRRGFDDAKCYVGMRYWHPYTRAALEEIQRDGINNLVVLPLYPHYSISTSGSSLKEVNQIFASDPKRWSADKLRHTVVPYWFSRSGYIDSMADLIIDKYEKFDDAQKKCGVDVLFSAHGVPKSYIEAGDPYQSHIRCCAALISLRVKQKLQEKVDAATGGLSNMFWRKKVTIDVKLPGDTSSFSSPDKGEETLPLRCRLSFQSRVGPVEWLRPYTDDVLRDMGEKEGVQNLIVVPISFVSEHIETLEEIDIEYMELAHKSGIKNWQRASALNTYDRFIRDLADMIEDAADGPTTTVGQALEKMQPNDMRQQGATAKKFAKILTATVVALLVGGPVLQRWRDL